MTQNITCVISVPLFMVVNPAVPAKTVPEFIAYAKANPRRVNMASNGNGGLLHLAGELFKMMSGVDLVHVPLSRRSARAYRRHKWASAGHVRRFDR